MVGTKKRAASGIGTLMLLAAGLVAVLFAFYVVMVTNNQFHELSIKASQETKTRTPMDIRVVQISASDGRNGSIQDFQALVRLSPASNPIKWNQVLISIHSYDDYAMLNYRGANASIEEDILNGFYTYETVRVDGVVDMNTNLTLTGHDMNNDGIDDHLSFDTATHELLYVFNDTLLADGYYRSLGRCEQEGPLRGELGTSLGYIKEIKQEGAICTGENALLVDWDENKLRVIPINATKGYFSVQYIYRGTNPVEGTIIQGDFARIYFQAPRGIEEAEAIKIKFMPRHGTPTTVDVYTPKAISQERLYLYPN